MGDGVVFKEGFHLMLTSFWSIFSPVRMLSSEGGRGTMETEEKYRTLPLLFLIHYFHQDIQYLILLLPSTFLLLFLASSLSDRMWMRLLPFPSQHFSHFTEFLECPFLLSSVALLIVYLLPLSLKCHRPTICIPFSSFTSVFSINDVYQCIVNAQITLQSFFLATFHLSRPKIPLYSRDLFIRPPIS